jgi:hypothetical protein
MSVGILCIWSFKHIIVVSARCGASWFRRFHLAYENPFLWTIGGCNKLQLVLLYGYGSLSCASDQVPREGGGEEWALNTGRQCRRTRISSVVWAFCCFFCLVHSLGITRVSYTVDFDSVSDYFFFSSPKYSSPCIKSERFSFRGKVSLGFVDCVQYYSKFHHL